MKLIATLISAEIGQKFGIDDSDLFSIINTRYVTAKKYIAPETIVAVLLAPMPFKHQEEFFLNALRRTAKKRNLEVKVDYYEDDKAAVEAWDTLKV